MIEESTTQTPNAGVSQVLKHEITTNRTIRKMYIALEDTGVATATSIAANNGPGDITPDAEIIITISANSRISLIIFSL